VESIECNLEICEILDVRLRSFLDDERPRSLSLFGYAVKFFREFLGEPDQYGRTHALLPVMGVSHFMQGMDICQIHFESLACLQQGFHMKTHTDYVQSITPHIVLSSPTNCSVVGSCQN